MLRQVWRLARKDAYGIVSPTSVIFNAAEVSQSAHAAKKDCPTRGGSPFLAEKVGFEPTRRVNGLRDFEPSPSYPPSSLLVTVYVGIGVKSPRFVPFIWKNVRKMIAN